MNVHYLQHSPVEGPGHVADWAAAHRHSISGTHWYRNDAVPDMAGIDLLVILGGGMNIYQHRDYPWLVREKELIGKVIGAGKPALGLCLGGQLIADVLGGKVCQNAEREIGWYPVRAVNGAELLPAEFTAMHWHGDTFELPPGAKLLAASEACPRQAYIWRGNVVGLQFHAEVREQEVRAYVDAETEPLPQGRYVQTFEELLAGAPRYAPAVHGILDGILDAIVG
jgi:GMP synthase-like glutamine amidotransferase